MHCAVQWLSAGCAMNGLPLQSGGAFDVKSLIFKHRCETEVWEQILLEYNRVEFMATWNNSHGVPILIGRNIHYSPDES